MTRTSAAKISRLTLNPSPFLLAGRPNLLAPPLPPPEDGRELGPLLGRDVGPPVLGRETGPLPGPLLGPLPAGRGLGPLLPLGRGVGPLPELLLNGFMELLLV